jgi:pimeloyl-ACP methyl ester carboxylesterase
MPGPRVPLWRNLLNALLRVAVMVVLALLIFQSRLIYVPQRYELAAVRGELGRLEPVESDTAAGRQVAFFVPPRVGPAARCPRLWLVFGGNAATALGWKDFVAGCGDERCAFLLIDYPGYGASAGSPSPAAILSGTEAAVGALAARLGVARADLEARCAVFGHSLGCAAALQYAAAHRVARIVLVSPFTSMLDMARRTVGWPLCQLLHHRFDNRARLAEIAATGAPPTVIFHGTDDEVIPVAMGRDLASGFPAIAYHEIPGADHNGILDQARELIDQAMAP